MILVSVVLFLRFDEVCDIELSHFEKEMFTVRNSDIQNLAVYVQGKTDDKQHLLSLVTNKYFFDLDVISTLLIYIAKRKHQSSKYLFPGKKGNKYSFTTFNSQVKILLSTVLGKTPTKNILHGTHIWRKTGYAVAMCGKYFFYFSN